MNIFKKEKTDMKSLFPDFSFTKNGIVSGDHILYFVSVRPEGTEVLEEYMKEKLISSLSSLLLFFPAVDILVLEEKRDDSKKEEFLSGRISEEKDPAIRSILENEREDHPKKDRKIFLFVIKERMTEDIKVNGMKIIDEKLSSAGISHHILDEKEIRRIIYAYFGYRGEREYMTDMRKDEDEQDTEIYEENEEGPFRLI